MREFISIVKRDGVKSIKSRRVLVLTPKGGKKYVTKFKVRSGRYLYTLRLDSREKADRLARSLPANLYSPEVPAKKKKNAQKKD